eukprot:2298041-Pyramimonas_sp.AAC.1
MDQFCELTCDAGIVVDGSARQCAYKELNRATSAAVFLAPGLQCQIKARDVGTVWPRLPQTAQSGKNLG